MSTTVVNTGTEGKTWGGGNPPLRASYGKMMMWFFIVSDALTFSGFLAAYGFSRFKFIDSWPIADEVFTHVPFLHGQDLPMIYVAFMTFVLIMSSVTMVLAVDAGHHLNKSKVKGGNILQFVDTDGRRVALRDFVVATPTERVQHKSNNGLWFVSEGSIPTYTVDDVIQGLESHNNVLVRTQAINEHGHKTVLTREESLKQVKSNAKHVVEGANLHENEYGSPLFADFFFFITGFHGFHVFSGVMINIIIFFNVILGTYEKRKSYEMVEKVGLYWHFVDLVWVFVFTFFYLV